MNGIVEPIGNSVRLVQTVPAKEPQMDAVPLKSALKKPPQQIVAVKGESKYQENANALMR